MKNETLSTKDVEDKIEVIRKKASLAFSKNFKLHIVLKSGKGWRNGYIKRMTPDFLIFKDNVNGEEPFFFLEIEDVEIYMKESKRKGEK